MNGFENIESKQLLKGNNKYNCNICKKLVEAEIVCKIKNLPNYLILNIDYGKNKINNVKKLIFEHEIDLQEYLSYYCGQKTKYKLVAICTHLGSSGPGGHYITFCLNKENKKWYEFNDSNVNICEEKDIYNGSPYLLLYKMI
jgi:ubiquitin C-terminal hydrolase